jgi:tight adherence protein C
MFLLPMLAVIVLLALRILAEVRHTATVTARLRTVRAGPSRTAKGHRSRLIGSVPAAAALGGILMRHKLLPRKTLHEAEMLLAGANLRGDTVIAGFIGGKVLLLAGLPPLAWVLARLAGLGDNLVPIAAVAGAAVALVLPDLLLGRRRRRRLIAIESGLPDALDLLVICVDAGLAFEPALERVAREIAPVHPDVAEELTVTVNALRISPDRHAVLMDMGERLEVDFLRQLAATLAQSLQIGAPLSRALRQLAVELRREQMVRIEARAARLPVLLTIPMVLFIMPTVLMVVGGPAAIQIIRTF